MAYGNQLQAWTYEEYVQEYEKMKKIVESYHTQCIAAMRVRSLGLCKRVIRHALDDEQGIKKENSDV